MTAEDLAIVPSEAMAVMRARTLANSHPTLLPLLRQGLSVLDVGCGPGTLTAEIARRVAPGSTVGMDARPEMIRAAEQASPPGSIRNLIFYVGDVRESGWNGEFDVVNAARTLQWIPNPDVAIARMKRAVAPGGTLVLLDLDHTRAEWSDPPKAWRRFYEAFLDWRQSARLDNAIACRLAGLCEAAGLADVTRLPRVTTVRVGDANFFRVAGRWRMIIESQGRQMVAARHLAESERRDALDAFTEWMKGPDATETVHEACILARRPAIG